MKGLILAIMIVTAVMPVYAQEEKVREDNFFSETVSSVFNKVEKVTSGEEKIFDENARGLDEKARPRTPTKRTPLEEKLETGS